MGRNTKLGMLGAFIAVLIVFVWMHRFTPILAPGGGIYVLDHLSGSVRYCAQGVCEDGKPKPP